MTLCARCLGCVATGFYDVHHPDADKYQALPEAANVFSGFGDGGGGVGAGIDL